MFFITHNNWKICDIRQEAFSWIFERLIFSRELTFFMKHCKKMGKSNCQNSSLKPWRGTNNENVRKHFQKMKRRISLEKTSKLDFVQNPSFFFSFTVTQNCEISFEEACISSAFGPPKTELTWTVIHRILVNFEFNSIFLKKQENLNFTFRNLIFKGLNIIEYLSDSNKK